MAYQALYRKYRPTTFNEVVGQETIIQTLKNAKAQIVLHMHIYFVVLEEQVRQPSQRFLRVC